MDKKVSVMIVEDSGVVREFLRHIISRDPRLEVGAVVSSGESALEALKQSKPDVISLDIRLPGINGLELTKRIMAEYPTPIVVVSSEVEDEELKISMNALRAGALAVVQKPVGLSHEDYEKLAEGLCTKLFIMSQVRVIRQRLRPLEAEVAIAPPPRKYSKTSARPAILGVVASTGGPRALVKLLGDLSPDFPAPIVVVQHITEGFVKGFVNWLDDVLPHFEVRESAHGMKVSPGTIYVARGGFHTFCASPDTLALSDSPPIGAQRPAGTVLFQSMARVFGAGSAGVLLTGMGEDGAAGLKEMCDQGAFTVAEHESTAIVYGMPAAAVKLGGAGEVLPLPDIAPRLNEIFLTP